MAKGKIEKNFLDDGSRDTYHDGVNEGLGTEYNDADAVRYYEIAASKGDLEAKAKLLEAYTYGKGVERSVSKINSLSKDLIKSKDDRFISTARYLLFVNADADERYGDALKYAREYFSGQSIDPEEAEYLTNYIVEMEERISKMSEEERRAFLKEPRKASDIFKSVFNNKKLLLATTGIILLIVIVSILIPVIRNSSGDVTKHAGNNTVGSNESENTKALSAYNDLLSQPSFIRDLNDGDNDQTWYSENCSFDIAYINDDDIPELILLNNGDSDHASGWGELYSYNEDDGVYAIGSISEPEGPEEHDYTVGYYERTGWCTDFAMWQGYGGPVIYNAFDDNSESMAIRLEPDENFEPSIVGYSIGSETVSEDEFYQRLEDVTGGVEITPYDFCENTEDNRLQKLGDFGSGQETEGNAESGDTSDVHGAAFEYLGMSFAELDSMYGPLTEQFYGEGAVYYATDDGRYVGFGWAGDEANPEERPCISYMGNIDEILNIPPDSSLEDIADAIDSPFNADELVYNADFDMGNCVIMYTTYNGQEYKIIVSYDENLDQTGATLAYTDR